MMSVRNRMADTMVKLEMGASGAWRPRTLSQALARAFV
jgi:hypothetical protein